MLTLPPRVYMGEMEVDVPTTKEIKVGNAEPVEFGQTLFVLTP